MRDILSRSLENILGSRGVLLRKIRVCSVVVVVWFVLPEVEKNWLDVVGD